MTAIRIGCDIDQIHDSSGNPWFFGYAGRFSILYSDPRPVSLRRIHGRKVAAVSSSFHPWVLI